MFRKRIGLLAGTAVAGGLLLAVTGTAIAQGPTSTPAATPSVVSGRMGGTMMGAVDPTASAAPGQSAAPSSSFGIGMMGSGGSGMDAGDVRQMQTWMTQAGPQHQAMHAAMGASGCSSEVMKQFLASPIPTK